MSKIAADNLRASTVGVETPMQYPVRGSAKAFANLQGTGTVAGRESLNISGYTDNGTGDYTFTYTSAMSAANTYTAFPAGGGYAGTDPTGWLHGVTTPNMLAAYVRCTTGSASAGTFADMHSAMVEVLGALA